MRKTSTFSDGVNLVGKLFKKPPTQSERNINLYSRSRSFDANAPVPHLPSWVIREENSAATQDNNTTNASLSPAVGSTDDDIDIRGDATSQPPTLYLLQLDADVQATTVDWFIGRVQGRRRSGGAELLVSAQQQTGGKGLLLHLTASRIKLLETAERMEMRKKDRAGFLREFICAELDEFLGDKEVDGLLSMSEKQRIVLHELEHIRARSTEQTLPGYPHIQLHLGQSVTQRLLQENIITQIFPIHDQKELDSLGKYWYASIFRQQPIEQIRTYFGESVALYFSFLGFYTTALCFPAILGIIELIVSMDTFQKYALCTLFNMLWVTVFLEAWKRHNNKLAYKWGVLEKTQLSFLEPRVKHRGELVRDLITGRYMQYYPRWKTLVKLYIFSIPVVVISLIASFCMMLASFWAEDYVALHSERYGSNVTSILVMAPSVVYSVAVYFMNKHYNKLTRALTEWENHRTQKQFDSSLVIKLASFEFVNSFMSLFYIAFYIRDLEMLRGQLATMLTIQQLISNIQEAFLPFFIRGTHYTMFTEPSSSSTDLHRFVHGTMVPKLKKNTLTRRLFESRALDDHEANDARVRVKILEPDDPRVVQANHDLELHSYSDAPDEYLEMFVQFGYVLLFSSVFPMAAFWAVFNNFIEIRADAFKMCKIYQRPPAKSVQNMGAWMPAFEVLGLLAVFTNCMLLCMSTTVRQLVPGLTSTQRVLVFVLLEHAVLALKMVLMLAVPSVPYWIREAMAQQQYQARYQLNRRRRPQTRRHLSNRFLSKSPAVAHDTIEAKRTAKTEGKSPADAHNTIEAKRTAKPESKSPADAHDAVEAKRTAKPERKSPADAHDTVEAKHTTKSEPGSSLRQRKH